MAGGSVKIRIDGDSRGFESTLKGVTEKTKAGLADVKAGIDMASAAISKFAEVAKKGIDYNAQIEQLQTSFEVMTGSAEKAEETVKRLRVMGAETPFETADLASVTQLLMQYGFTADDALEKMSMLGDIAQGNKEAMVSIATGYAQMSSAGKVNLQDIKQMINGGFNPLQEISERTGESMESLYDRISKGTLQINEITDSMKYATSEGGKFYQSMEKQSQTLSGQLSTLTDNVNELLGSITRGMSDDLAGSFLPAVNEMIGQLQNAMETGGTDALINTATDMIPDLLDMLSGKLETGISALSKWAPKGVEALMKAVPSSIKASTSAIPQITSALFDVASVVITDLIGMLPELVPMLAEGVYDMFASVFTGILKMVAGLVQGVEKAIHNEQTQIFGKWFANSDITKYKFGATLDVDVDSADAKSAVETAYAELREALEAGPLTQEQREQILDMLGSDAGAIKDKLKEFGMSDTQATELAGQITGSYDKINDALKGIDVGVDAATIGKWFVQANGSNVALMHYAREAGLSDEDVDEIVGVFNQAQGRLADETPSFVQTIYEKLTDGLTDDAETVNDLKDHVNTWADGALRAATEGYNEAVGELDVNDPQYQQRLTELRTEYETAKGEIESIRDDSLVIIDNLAGQSTQSVENAYQTITGIEGRVNALETRIEALKGKSLSEAEQAFKVVRAGGKADETTIQLAVDLKFNEFKIDEQSAQDAYDKAITDLNAKFDKGDITVDEYNAGVEAAEAAKDAAIEKAKAEYERAMGEIFAGLAKSEGNYDALMENGADAAVMTMLTDFVGKIADVGVDNIPAEEITAISAKIREIFGEATGQMFTADKISEFPVTSSAGILLLAQGILDNMDTTALEGKVKDVFQSALESGILAGTSFETETPSAQIAAIYSSIYTDAATTAEPDASAAGEALGNEAAAGVEKSKDAFEASSKSAVNGAIAGIDGKQTDAYNAGVRLANSINRGFRNTLEINSPSRVMMRNGEYVGQGLEQGLTASMARAVMVAKRISGQIVTAADLSQTMRVNIPGLAQEIVVANEQSTTPVNLDGKQIATIQGPNNRAQLAFERARTARGFGY